MRIHSLLSPKCRVSRSAIDGRGVFAEQAFKRDELVAVWGGKIYTEDEVTRLADVCPRFGTHTVSVFPGYFLGSDDLFELDDAELFNHCCEANIGIRGQIVLVARRDVRVGEELTFDYDTTEVSAMPFECRCGALLCRKTIDGSGWRDPAFVSRNWDYLSWHIQAMLRVRGSAPS